MKYDFTKMSISDIISACLKCETIKQASELQKQFEAYCDTPQIARRNLGYIFGYTDAENREKLYKLFNVSHPIFGASFGR